MVRFSSHQQPKNTPHAQAQSALFALPAELRRQIFSLALSCSPIPLAAIGPRREEVLQLPTPGIGGPSVQALRDLRPLSLVLSCTRARDEALPLLYGENVFSVGDPAVLPLLVARSGAAALVRRLDFSWTLSETPSRKSGETRPSKSPLKALSGFLGRPSELDQRWELTWAAVAQFERLDWLRVELSVPHMWRPGWRSAETELLQVLAALPGDTTRAELVLSWERPESSQRGAAEELLAKWTVERRVT